MYDNEKERRLRDRQARKLNDIKCVPLIFNHFSSFFKTHHLNSRSLRNLSDIVTNSNYQTLYIYNQIDPLKISEINLNSFITVHTWQHTVCSLHRNI